MYRYFIFDKRASLIEEIRFSNLDTRLLQWLQSQEEKKVSISHEELGEILGTSREVISRLLKGLEKSGRVKLSRRMIEIL